MISQEQLFAWCEAHKAEQLALLKELAAIPSPSHHEEKRAEFIKAWLEKAGAKNVTIDPALNVLLPFGDCSKPCVVYAAHIDVVFPDTTPLPVVEKPDGTLHAPGVGDDTANVVALMLMAKYIFEATGTQVLEFIYPSSGTVLYLPRQLYFGTLFLSSHT